MDFTGARASSVVAIQEDMLMLSMLPQRRGACTVWRRLFLAGALVLSALASAGDTTSKILAILAYSNGNIVYIYPVGGVQGAPSCHGGNGNYYTISMARPMAKEYLALLASAQARGATVWFHGTGACSEQSFAETLDYITVYE